MDAVQCGHFRTGRFQSYQRILENAGAQVSNLRAAKTEASRGLDSRAPAEFLPDGISMAKSLGGGFPIGAAWIRQPYADLLGPGTHGTTFGGTPLGCAVALKILEVIREEKLDTNVRELGEFLKAELLRLKAKYPTVITAVRGLGFMIGIELAEKIPALNQEGKAISMQMVNRLHAAGLMTIPSGNQVIRLLPPLNLSCSQADEGLTLIESVVRKLA